MSLKKKQWHGEKGNTTDTRLARLLACLLSNWPKKQATTLFFFFTFGVGHSQLVWATSFLVIQRVHCLAFLVEEIFQLKLAVWAAAATTWQKQMNLHLSLNLISQQNNGDHFTRPNSLKLKTKSDGGDEIEWKSACLDFFAHTFMLF